MEIPVGSRPAGRESASLHAACSPCCEVCQKSGTCRSVFAALGRVAIPDLNAASLKTQAAHFAPPDFLHVPEVLDEVAPGKAGSVDLLTLTNSLHPRPFNFNYIIAM